MAGSGEKRKRKMKSGSRPDSRDDANHCMNQLPPRLVSYLMPFQREGVLFAIRKDGRCLIADEMGLGKTLQAIAVARYFQSEWPVLIIVPSSLRYAWVEELEKWLPDVLPHDIHLIQGGFDVAGIAEAKITIVTYGLLSCKSSGTVKEALKARDFKIVICDESHYFKNGRTECCKAVTPLLTSATRRILLSGTPALAKPSELFTQLDALLPGQFGSFWSFTAKYCAAHWQHFGRQRRWKADGASNLDELQQRLKSVMIRREKSSVLTQLPPKQRQKILFALKDSQTKKEILSTFEELKPLLKKSKSSLAEGLLGGDKNSADTRASPEGVHDAQAPDTNILSRIQRLYNLTGEAKVGPAREYIQMLCENASLKFLVFAYHHTMMDGLQQTLWDRNVKFVRIDGHTKPSDRQLYVQQFQCDSDTRVAILSILASGVGLTLTAASLVVFAELYWTPGVMIQCEDRTHRIGQTNTVAVHYLVARETMDEWVWSAVCRKTLVTSSALSGERRALKADAGDRYQVELLSAADAYTPVDNAEIDISQLIQSQRPQDQKSILDFFGSQSDPSQCAQSSTQSASTCRPSPTTAVHLDSENDSPPTSPATPCDKGRKQPFPLFTSLKKPSQSTSVVSQQPVVVDSSDDDGEVTNIGQDFSRLENEAESEDRNYSELEYRSQSKSVIGRKRKRVVREVESKSDSEFADLPSDCSHSVKKHKKSSSKSAASVPKNYQSNSRQKRERQSDMSSALHTERGEGGQWACSSCTFSNSSLLPFCEICETPRKSKDHMDAGKPCIRAELSETAKSPPPLLLEDDVELSPPACASTQISKRRPHEKCFQGTSVESACETQSGSFQHTSRPRVKRNLTFDVDTSTAVEESADNKTDKPRRQNKDIHLVTSSQETDDSACSLELDRESVSIVSETDCYVSQDEEFVSFQLNSSMEKDDGCGSPCLSDIEEEDTCVVTDDEAETTSSFSTQQSTPVCNSSSKLSVTKSASSASESAKKCKSADFLAGGEMPEDSSSDVNNARTAEENKKVKNGEPEESAIPEIKPPKRKCFMLGTPKKQVREISPVKNAIPLVHNSQEHCSETREKTSNGSHAGVICDGKDHDISAEKVKKTPKKSYSCKKGQALCNGELSEASTGACDGKPQDQETPPFTTKDGEDAARDACRVEGEPGSVGVSGRAGTALQGHLQQSSDDTHSFFMFCCSSYTGRVYLFDEHGQSLKANFLPLDVELNNVSELPDILHHPQHLRLAQHFVRQWNSLTDTKRRLIVKRQLKFRNPLAAYDLVRTDLANNKQRYHTKEDQAKAALKVAREVKGQVRVLTKRGPLSQRFVRDDNQQETSGSVASDITVPRTQGYAQVMSADGTPLCVHCQQPYTSLVSRETSASEDTAWNTRFCSRVCADAYWMKTNTAYLRSSVYDVQRGICQLCGFDAHSFFCQIRDGLDRKQRAEKINCSKFSKLGSAQKKQMIARPYEGLFWHVDHIRPVWEGGGQCDIDNLRTLCTPCHLSVTAKQAAKRAHARKLSRAACAGDITAFFKKS